MIGRITKKIQRPSNVTSCHAVLWLLLTYCSQPSQCEVKRKEHSLVLSVMSSRTSSCTGLFIIGRFQEQGIGVHSEVWMEGPFWHLEHVCLQNAQSHFNTTSLTAARSNLCQMSTIFMGKMEWRLLYDRCTCCFQKEGRRRSKSLNAPKEHPFSFLSLSL